MKIQPIPITTDKLLTEKHLEFLSLKGGCTGSAESTLVKIPHCWKSHAAAHFIIRFPGDADHYKDNIKNINNVRQ